MTSASALMLLAFPQNLLLGSFWGKALANETLAAPEPCSYLLFAHLANSDPTNSPNDIRLVVARMLSIGYQESLCNSIGRSLVAIDKAMIASQPEGVGGGQVEDIAIPTISRHILRARQG